MDDQFVKMRQMLRASGFSGSETELENLANGLVNSGARFPAHSHTQWGVVGGPGRQTSRVETHCTDPGGRPAAYDESLARYDTASRPEDLKVREHFVYNDSYGPWRDANG